MGRSTVTYAFFRFKLRNVPGPAHSRTALSTLPSELKSSLARLVRSTERQESAATGRWKILWQPTTTNYSILTPLQPERVWAESRGLGVSNCALDPAI